MTATRSRLLIISEAVYRRLLLAYPAEFRQRFEHEMAQVFRTCCRFAFDSSGVKGLLRLWLPTLWDWAWSALGERFSSLFRRSPVYTVHTRRSGSQLVSILFFANACLVLLFVSPCFWLGPGFPFGDETCGIRVDNQYGKTLRVTPFYVTHPYSAVRLYRLSFPYIPAYRQRNIPVKPGEQITLVHNCTQEGPLGLYACDPDGECYVHPSSFYTSPPPNKAFIFNPLLSLSRPDASLVAAIQSFPEHDTSGVIKTLACGFGLIAFGGGIFTLIRLRTVGIPKGEI